jgi:hypothetical protein
MKWPKLIGLLVLALGIAVLCCCGPRSFGTGLRNISNAMDSWPRESFLALDIFAALLIGLSFFLYRARNWARLVVLAGCISFSVLAVIGAVLLAVLVSNVVDVAFIAGLLMWWVAGPLLLFFILRQPEVVKEFAGEHAQQDGCTEARDSAPVSNPGPVARAR